MLFSSRAFLLISCLHLAAAFDIRGHVAWNEVCSDAQRLGHSKVVLDQGHHSGGILRNGEFEIPGIPTGTYILSVISHDFTFDQLRIDVLNTTPSSIEVHPYIPGTPLKPASSVSLPHPITLVPKQRHNYFVPHESFSLMAMLSNPMMMLMLVTAGMALGAPYLMKNLDPDALEEMRANQAKIASAQSALASGDLKSGLSALLDDSAPSQSQSKAQSQSPQASAQNKSRSNKNKRR